MTNKDLNDKQRLDQLENDFNNLIEKIHFDTTNVDFNKKTLQKTKEIFDKQINNLEKWK